MKELKIIIKDQEKGTERIEEIEVSDDTLAEAATVLALKNAYTRTEAEKGGMEIARALGGTRQKPKDPIS